MAEPRWSNIKDLYNNGKMLLKSLNLRKHGKAADVSDINSALPSLNLRNHGKAAAVSDINSALFYSEVKEFILNSNGIPVINESWYKLENKENLKCNVLIVLEGFKISQFVDGKKATIFKNESKKDSSQNRPSFQKFSPFCNAILQFTHNINAGDFTEDLYNCYQPKNELRYNSDMGMYKCEKFRHNGILRKDLEEILISKDQFDRRKLLVSLMDMPFCGFTMPSSQNPNVKFTKSSYQKVKKDSPMFALDCEMVTTLDTLLKYDVSLAKISIVDENLKLIYSSFVKPRDVIVNYVTWVTGITENDLKYVTTRLEDVQKDITELLPDDAILVGHGLDSDMRTLKLVHPYYIDTSRLYNIMGDRNSLGLKKASHIFLRTKAHADKKTHDPTEDACLSMLLAKLKLSKSLQYGDLRNGWKCNIDIIDEEHKSMSIMNVFELYSKYSVCPSVIHSAMDDATVSNIKQYTNITKETSNERVLYKTAESLSNNRNIIAHLKQEEGDDLIANKLDEHICQLYEALPSCSMLTVLVPRLNLDNRISNGYVFIAIKN